MPWMQSVGLERIRIHLLDNGQWACVQVIDSGEGISDENLDKVFDPFFTTRTDLKKIGLGLTIAQSLVNTHGGRIEISSSSGHGTNVMIMLPLEMHSLQWSAK